MEFLSGQGKEAIKTTAPACYRSNNNYAYHYEVYKVEPTPENERRLIQDSKIYNFVPTYDHWCLACGTKGVNKRCTRCRTVYFCDMNCAKKAWKIHKKHCGRDLFANCCFCGLPFHEGKNAIDEDCLKCEYCPVKFCNAECREQIYKNHLEYDCQNFQRLFGSEYKVNL